MRDPQAYRSALRNAWRKNRKLAGRALSWREWSAIRAQLLKRSGAK